MRASIHVEAAMMEDSDEPAHSDGFFILDGLTPRHLKLTRLLDAVEVSICAALHDN